MADVFVYPWPATQLGVSEPVPPEPVIPVTPGRSLLFVFSMKITNKAKESFILKSAVPQMIPRFVIEENPRFASFIERWCDFVERYYDPDGTKNPGPYFVLKNLLPLVDIDQTLEQFVRYHKFQYGSDLPDISAADAVHVLKRVREFYQTKGSPRSFEYFFRFVFNSFLRIELPKEKILRASGGIWNKPYLLRLKHMVSGVLLSAIEQAALFDLGITGETSGTRAFLGYTIKYGTPYFLPTQDRQGFFIEGETVTLSNGDRYVIAAGGIVEPPGSWLTTDGFISSNMKLQDSYYWQDFSYVLVSTEGLGTTINPVLKNLHPAGLKLFARISPEGAFEVPFWPENWDWNLRRLFVLHLMNWVPYTGVLDEGTELEIPTSEPSTTSIVMSSRIQAFYDGSQFQRTKETVEWQHWNTISQGSNNTIASISEEVRQEKNSICFLGGLKLPSDSHNQALTVFGDIKVQSADAGILSYDLGSTMISVFGDILIGDMKFVTSYELPAYTETFAPNQIDRAGASFSWISGRPVSEEIEIYKAKLHFQNMTQDGIVSFATAFAPGTTVAIEGYPLIPTGVVLSISNTGIGDYNLVVSFETIQSRNDFVDALFATFAQNMTSNVVGSGKLNTYDSGPPRSGSDEGHLLFRNGRLVPRGEYFLGLSNSRTTITVSNPVVGGQRELYEFIESPKWTRLDFTVTSVRSVLAPGVTSIEDTMVFVNGFCLAGGSQSFVQDGKVQFSNPVTGSVVVVYWDNPKLVMSRVKTTLEDIRFRSGDTNRSFLGVVPDRMLLVATDPYFAFVTLLCNFTGADGSTSFVDLTGKTITKYGNTQIGTSGGQHGLFDGSGDYLTVPDSEDWRITDQFTNEIVVSLDQADDQGFLGQWINSDAWYFYLSGGQLKMRMFSTTAIYTDLVYNWTPTLNQKYHLAIERDGSNKLRMYIDGVMVASIIYAATMPESAQPLVIGAIGQYDNFPAFDFKGKIYGVRLTKGIARYATDTTFVVPALPFLKM